MSLIPWKPFSDLDKFFGDDLLMPIFSRAELTKPAIDIKETEKDIIAEIEVPGFDPQKIDVSVEDGFLRIRGSVDEKKEDKEEGYWRREIRRGSFERMIRLPAAIKEDSVEAVYEKGILKVVLPKAEAKPSAKVPIQIKGK